MRMWMMTFFLLVTATTGVWADMTVSTFEQELIPACAHGSSPWAEGPRDGRGFPSSARTSNIAVSYQLDHGWVVMSAGSVARNTLLDWVAGPETIWLEVRPKNWFPVICAVVETAAFQTARALEEDRSLRIWFPVICRLELA